MRIQLRSLVLLSAALPFGACGSDNPSTPPAPTTPVAVATPTPTPSPSPTATPGAPFVSISARVLGFTRAGIRYSFVPDPFRNGDSVDLDCTPRDADGRSTPNHPMSIEWYSSSNGGLVIDRDYVLDYDNTFNPVLYIRTIAGKGYIDVFCRLAGKTSNIIHMNCLGR